LNPGRDAMPSRKPSKYGNKFRSGATSFQPRGSKTVQFSALYPTESTSQNDKFEAIRLANGIDENMGFHRFESGEKRAGWLTNMHSTSVEDESVSGGRAGVEFYFLEDGGSRFKATVEYDPYFLIAVKGGREAEVEEWCRRMFEGLIKSVKRTEKEDLQTPNHLLGYRRTFLQLNFANVSHLLEVRKKIMPIAEKNKKNMTAMDTYAEMARSIAPIFSFFFLGNISQFSQGKRWL
jgi:DNA polymerase epsilon subunit 1